MDNRETIINRIEKIMRRTKENGCTESEVEAAMHLARQMMEKYNIELAEVLTEANAKLNADDVIEEVARDAAKFDRHENYLLNVAVTLCDCKAYITTSTQGGPRRTRKTITIYGLKNDVLAAKSLFTELLVAVRVLARANVGSGWTQRHFYYCDGFAAGLYSKALAIRKESEIKANTNCKGLIVAKQQLITEHEAHLGLKKTKARGMDEGRRYSKEFSQGERDGKSYAIDRRQGKLDNGNDQQFPRIA